ncbi:hypothetical protein CGZ96_01750 [Enemella evansiae]|uniref:polymorphic toxin type 15 domain-containing protein n=1 Tax=Enemella evansiae TaxID=2016499 RepID=UPI000B96AD7F|nr:polymorphic toxin type 15 domain-containing protein [Enemella evansiae]OYO02907.1 hypothetical protein CGZ96_01750 [Enemella evansiae]OYO12234.1 hypothetical protein CGZ98_08640 [Enemella evansiae]
MRSRAPGRVSPTDLERMRGEARALANDELKSRNVDALHNPDMVAGGADQIHAFGDSGVNRSLGSGWQNNMGEMDVLERQLREDLAAGRFRPGDRMNVRLTPQL